MLPGAKNWWTLLRNAIRSSKPLFKCRIVQDNAGTRVSCTGKWWISSLCHQVSSFWEILDIWALESSHNWCWKVWDTETGRFHEIGDKQHGTKLFPTGWKCPDILYATKIGWAIWSFYHCLKNASELFWDPSVFITKRFVYCYKKVHVFVAEGPKPPW